MASETWDLVEQKMTELRILTNANWKNGEYELAVLGEKVLRTAELARSTREGLNIAEQAQKTAVTA